MRPRVACSGPAGYILPMPLYEFECRRCGRRFEELVRLEEVPACPACGDAEPTRLFSASAGVSTDKTRRRSASQARRAAGAVKKEKDHAQREYERNYIKDHS
jgi:putative FmdB family regulatory protein